jgi:hypothetical protein
VINLPPQPSGDRKYIVGDIIYIPRIIFPDGYYIPERIGKISEITEKTLVIDLGSNSKYPCNKTEYALTFFDEDWFNWLDNIYQINGAIAGFFVVENRYPELHHFQLQVMKLQNPLEWLRLKNKYE